MPGPNIPLVKLDGEIKGNVHKGLACTGMSNDVDFILVAKDEESLKVIWDKFMRVELNPAKCKPVIVAPGKFE